MYYDDAIQAAYMQREFGVQLRAISKSGAVCGVISFDAVSLKPDGYTYHIHPDNQAIFEPQKGDLWAMPSPYSSFYISTEADMSILNKEVYKDGRIIQRQGKPFFMPKEGS